MTVLGKNVLPEADKPKVDTALDVVNVISSFPTPEQIKAAKAADRAEKQAARFAREHPQIQVATLRFAPILGPTINNLHTRFFSRVTAPVMAGHDPLMQFVHEQDAAWALKRAVDSDAVGPFNIVGKGVLPYTTVLALMGRVPVPLPFLLARSIAKALWATQIVSTAPSLLDYLLYVCVADGSRATRDLGFTARFSIKRRATFPSAKAAPTRAFRLAS